MNHTQHIVDVAENIIVPEPQHAIAARIEKFGSNDIGIPLMGMPMLPAVQLYDEAWLVTGEVNEIWSDRCLATEV